VRRSTTIIFVTLAVSVIFGIGCGNADPITISPNAPGVAQLAFLAGLTARYSPSTTEVWIGAPPGFCASETIVRVEVKGELPRRIQSLTDGSFIYKFMGDESSSAQVEYTDPSGAKHHVYVAVTDPSGGLELSIGSPGLYPNRMNAIDDKVWIVNSGDDELASYDLDSLDRESAVSFPPYSNPWEADFVSSTEGLITTLFSGIFRFNTTSGATTQVSTEGFTPFASPNGVAILGDAGWVANPNPISYFPTEFGIGWVSEIGIDESPAVVAEINTQWLNPQNVITDGNYVYVCCSGTIDFIPPDYLPAALDPGGVHVIDPEARTIVASYELGICGPGPMGLSPDSRYMYIGSGVAGWLFRIDLENGVVLNDAQNPIVISEAEKTYIPFIEVSDEGLLACASFNTDTIHFIDSWTGEVDPFPFFGPIELHPDDPDALWGPQDAAFVTRDGEEGLLVMTTIESRFHWVGF